MGDNQCSSAAGHFPLGFFVLLQDRATGYIKFGARWYDPATGVSVGASCTAGGVQAGVDTNGNSVSGNYGVNTGTDVGCEADAPIQADREHSHGSRSGRQRRQFKPDHHRNCRVSRRSDRYRQVRQATLTVLPRIGTTTATGERFSMHPRQQRHRHKVRVVGVCEGACLGAGDQRIDRTGGGCRVRCARLGWRRCRSGSCGRGVGVGTGEDGSGTNVGATASGNNIESGAYASASCAYGNSDVGVTVNSSGVWGDCQIGATSTGECSGFVGYNG